MGSKRILDKIVCIDVESTCWEPPESQPHNETSDIIEIGVALVDLSTLKVEKNESILVRPDRSKVSEFCTKLTTLTQEQVAGGVSLDAACNYLRTIYKSHERTWLSWGDYDRTMFERCCGQQGIKYPFGPRHINLKNLIAVLHNLPKEVGMPDGLELLALPFKGTHHRGVDDVANIANIFVAVSKLYRGPNF